MTGLPLDAVAKARGFVTDAFFKTLRNGKVVSRYDADFAVDDPYPEERAARGPDPILDGFARAYGGAFANYARNELGYQTEMTYKLLAGDVDRSIGIGAMAAADRPASTATCACCSRSIRISACWSRTA